MIVDLFAGPGGWDEGLRLLGHTGRVVGVEWDADACRTAKAAGHARIRADVAALDPGMFAGASGLIASPPCQDFSTAGRMLRDSGPSGQYVREALRYVRAVTPEWTAWEQVPGALTVWHECAVALRRIGYQTWVGILNSADYGVPQERRRAVLLASRSRRMAPPAPTHHLEPDGLFGDYLPWVTMADALAMTSGWRYDSGQNSRAADGGTERYVRSCDRPAGTITGQTTSQWVLLRGDERRKLTTADSARLQSFRDDYPWSGSRESRDQQVGNAVPPLLAAHLLSVVTGLPAARLAANQVAA